MLAGMTTLSIGGACAMSELELNTEDLAKVSAEHQIPDISSVLPDRQGSAVRLSGLAELAQASEAKFVHVASDDGSFTANLPIDQALNHGLVLYALDGEALPGKFGGPFRLMVAEGDDCSVNVKFLASLEFLAEPGSHTAQCSD